MSKAGGVDKMVRPLAYQDGSEKDGLLSLSQARQYFIRSIASTPIND